VKEAEEEIMAASLHAGACFVHQLIVHICPHELDLEMRAYMLCPGFSHDIYTTQSLRYTITTSYEA
jgi:hypothetical protein